MLKCIRINLYKKKLKYNLKLFKFRKSSQVLFSGQECVIRGLWMASQGGAGRKEKEAAMVLHQSEGFGTTIPTPGMPRGMKDLRGGKCWQTIQWAAGPRCQIKAEQSGPAGGVASRGHQAEGTPLPPSTQTQIPEVTQPRAPSLRRDPGWAEEVENPKG